MCTLQRLALRGRTKWWVRQTHDQHEHAVEHSDSGDGDMDHNGGGMEAIPKAELLGKHSEEP